MSASLLFLAPQLYGDPGGVQTYMQRLREIVGEYGEARGIRCRCLSLNDGKEDRHLHARPVSPAPFEGFERSNWRFTVDAARDLRRNRGAALVVGHLGLAPVAWALAGLGLAGPYALVLHGIEAWRRASFLDRRGARGAARIVVTTCHTADVFADLHDIPRDRFRVVALALAHEDLELPAARPDDERLELLSVGRMSRDDRAKGFDSLIAAVARARAGGADVRLTLVGDGEERRRLGSLAEERGIDEHVEFTGWISDEELEGRYAGCDVFALPSGKEGFGIVFIEAMAHGKPCIGGDRGGTPEIVDHGETGFLVEPDDVDGLAARIVELQGDPGLRERMGRRGWQKARRRYLFGRMRDEWFEFLDELTGRS